MGGFPASCSFLLKSPLKTHRRYEGSIFFYSIPRKNYIDFAYHQWNDAWFSTLFSFQASTYNMKSFVHVLVIIITFICFILYMSFMLTLALCYIFVLFQIEALVGKFGLVVITREGSNPYKFIYESDVLTRHQVCLLSLSFMCFWYSLMIY